MAVAVASLASLFFFAFFFAVIFFFGCFFFGSDSPELEAAPPYTAAVEAARFPRAPCPRRGAMLPDPVVTASAAVSGSVVAVRIVRGVAAMTAGPEPSLAVGPAGVGIGALLQPAAVVVVVVAVVLVVLLLVCGKFFGFSLSLLNRVMLLLMLLLMLLVYVLLVAKELLLLVEALLPRAVLLCLSASIPPKAREEPVLVCRACWRREGIQDVCWVGC